MRTLYFAEKPDIARAIAEHLWGAGAQKLREQDCYRKGDIVVTWSFGHMLRSLMPDEYDERYKSRDLYPFIPTIWQKVVKPDAKVHYNAVKKMLKETDVVYHAGDPDREGQLLIDEILDKECFRGRVVRLLINAKDDVSMTRAFEHTEPNEKFRNLYLAALAREQADYTIGINCSRLYDANARKQGIYGLCSIGRVRTPTLALVVRREHEIADFRPVDYFILSGKYSKDGVPFKATLKVEEKDDAPQDSEGRILQRDYLEKVQSAIAGEEAKVISVEKKSGTEDAPAPYSLSKLQTEVEKHIGLSPDDTLKTVQSLYEKKLVSYPRSDSEQIPDSQHQDASRILNSLAQYGIAAACNADASTKSKAFVDTIKTPHHAIIPTGVTPSGITDIERKVFEMIALRYVLQFYPKCKFDTVRFKIESDGHVFTGSGKKITDKGWRIALGNGNNKEDDGETPEDSLDSHPSSSLPAISVGDILKSPTYEIETHQTKCSKRFTEGSMIEAMTKPWLYFPIDKLAKDELRKCEGIGTPATRASILSDLINKDKFIMKKGRELIPTPAGECLIENVDKTLTDPSFTAEMESKLSDIADGSLSHSQFMKDVRLLLDSNIRFAESRTFTKPQCDNSAAGAKGSQQVTCPICGNQTLRRFQSKKDKKQYFWVCTDKACVHPVTKKPMFYDDSRGKPMIKTCPECGTVLRHGTSLKTGKAYWRCEKCAKFVSM